MSKIETPEKCYWKSLLEESERKGRKEEYAHELGCNDCDGYDTKCNNYILERELWSWYNR